MDADNIIILIILRINITYNILLPKFGRFKKILKK